MYCTRGRPRSSFPASTVCNARWSIACFESDAAWNTVDAVTGVRPFGSVDAEDVGLAKCPVLEERNRESRRARRLQPVRRIVDEGLEVPVLHRAGADARWTEERAGREGCRDEVSSVNHG